MDGAQLLPLIGVVVGVTIQFVLSRVGVSAKAKSTLRVQAYVDYIACLSDSAHLLSRDKAEFLARATDAKTRISIYGSADVVAALAVFEKAGGQTAVRCSLVCYAQRERRETTESVRRDPSDRTVWRGSPGQHADKAGSSRIVPNCARALPRPEFIRAGRESKVYLRGGWRSHYDEERLPRERSRVLPKRMFFALSARHTAVPAKMPEETEAVKLHPTTTSSCLASGGKARKDSSRLCSRMRVIASRRFAMHSSRDFPWPLAPGTSAQ